MMAPVKRKFALRRARVMLVEWVLLISKYSKVVPIRGLHGKLFANRLGICRPPRP